jgi:hypothetical protein
VLAGIGATIWGRGYQIRRWSIRLTVASFTAAALAILALIFFASENRAVTLLTQAVIALGLLGTLAGILTLTQPEAETRGHQRWSFVVLLVIALDLAWAAWDLNPTVPASFYDPVRIEGQQVRRYMPKTVEEAVKFERYFRFDSYPAAVAQRHEVRASGLPNLNLLDRIPMLNNFDPLLVGHFSEYIDLAAEDSALLTGAGVGIVYDQDGALQPFQQDAARAWLVTSVCWHEDQVALKAALVDPDWRPDQQAHMLGDGGCADPETPNGSVEITADSGNTLTLKVDAARDSWLILADTDYPGWRALVDDAETPVYRANLNFRAVQVDAGSHEIRFEYRPGWLLPGALISVIALVAALLLYRLGA